MNPGYAFTVELRVQIRECVEEDLPNLEWFGMFSAHREIIRSAYEAQLRGDGAMLVAEVNGLPVGQVWLDFVSGAGESAGFVWALRVVPWLQRLGIGRRLLETAETLLSERGFAFAEISADIENVDAQRLYEARGYRPAGTRVDEYSYVTPEGVPVRATETRAILRKALFPVGLGRKGGPVR